MTKLIKKTVQNVLDLYKNQFAALNFLGDRFVPELAGFLARMQSFMIPLAGDSVGQGVINAAYAEGLLASPSIELGREAKDLETVLWERQNDMLTCTAAEQYRITPVCLGIADWLVQGPGSDVRAWVEWGKSLQGQLDAPWGYCPECQGKKTPLIPQKLQSGDWRVPDACGSCKRERRLVAEKLRSTREAEKAARKQELEATKKELDELVKGFAPVASA